MSRPSQDEKEPLIQLRERLGDVLKTAEQRSDPFLLRWLRARDLDLDKTEDMILSSLKWRKENEVDELLSRGLDPWMKDNYPFKITGPDREGRPVVILPVGSWDMRKAINENLESKLLDHSNGFFEMIIESIRQMNDGLRVGDYPVTQVIIIVDWKNYSYSQLIHFKALQSVLRLAATYEAHYPEILYRAFFINCPSIFPLFMALLKPIIAAKTLEKITCHSNQNEWEPALQEVVPVNQLPPNMGGTLDLTDATIQITRRPQPSSQVQEIAKTNK